MLSDTGEMLELTDYTGTNCCATVRAAQVEDTTSGTDGRRGPDELHSKPIGRGHQLRP